MTRKKIRTIWQIQKELKNLVEVLQDEIDYNADSKDIKEAEDRLRHMIIFIDWITKNF